MSITDMNYAFCLLYYTTTRTVYKSVAVEAGVLHHVRVTLRAWRVLFVLLYPPIPISTCCFTKVALVLKPEIMRDRHSMNLMFPFLKG